MRDTVGLSHSHDVSVTVSVDVTFHTVSVTLLVTVITEVDRNGLAGVGFGRSRGVRVVRHTLDLVTRVRPRRLV